MAPPWQDRGGLTPGPVGTPAAVLPIEAGVPLQTADKSRMQWVQSFQGLVWSAVSADITARATWTSPVFDLRPELGHPEGIEVGAAQSISRSATLGSGGHLHVIVRNPSGLPTGIAAYTQESVSGWDPAAMFTLHGWQDVTGDLYDGDQCWLAVFEPAGAPIRFWQASIRFDAYGLDPAAMVNLVRVGAAFY